MKILLLPLTAIACAASYGSVTATIDRSESVDHDVVRMLKDVLQTQNSPNPLSLHLMRTMDLQPVWA